MEDIYSILKQYWGYSEFRSLQEDVINSVLNDRDTLALMPTGGGKSLCYQVPALARSGLCLVISPLIALMKDQVENIRKKGVTAFAIYSGMTRKEVVNILKTVRDSNCKFLYVSPERLETSLFKEYLPGFDITLIAVDEAHCVSQWGYDFRPSYLRIALLREELPGIPVLALTASATPEVQKDICDKLLFTNESVFRQSFARPNLSYSVFKVDSKINKITDILKKVSGTAIVYCKSRKRTREISDLLRMQNISSDFYHAGLSQDDRNRKQEDWMKDKTRTIVCTNAFGMGIDKPGVRVVIHADMPDCLENYYQEAGRAGRDRKKSFAVLLYSDKDLKDLEETGMKRFPSLEEIRLIYQSLANFLQIPINDGEGNSYDFDITDFVRKFNLNSYAALYSLKALEQDGWLSFNEQVFLPSKVMVCASKTELVHFETEHPAKDPLVKALLRSYEGILDQHVNISEKVIAGLLKKDYTNIREELTMLHRNGIIDYEPQKDSPQITLLLPRIKASDITIDMQLYNKRKELFSGRLKKITDYAKEDIECRSTIIGKYFGDNDITSCGVCDNCLAQKKASFNNEEFKMVYARIIELIKNEKLRARDLLEKLNDVNQENAWKVLDFLQAEEKITIDTEGILRET